MPVRVPIRASAALLGTVLVAAAGCSSHAPPRSAPASAASAGSAPSAPPSEAASPKQRVQNGNDLLRRGLLDEAEREFRLALEADPNDLGALAGLGQVAIARGRYTEALAPLERATQISGQLGSAFHSLGDAYAATGELAKAAAAYRQAVALAPADVDVRLSLARALTEIGEYSEAREACLAATRLVKGSPAALASAYRQLGDTYSHEGKTPEAMAALYRAGELDPQNPEVARGLATSAVRGGLYGEAAAAYTRLLTLAPLDLDAKKQLAWVNFKLERYPIAIKHYEAVGESLGTVDRYYLAQAYAKSNKVDRAVDLFREVVRLDPQNYGGVYCNMAYAYYDANRYQRAIEVAREGLAGDSTSACLRFCWAQALDKLGRHEDAIPVFETVLGDPAYAESAKRELERQRRIVRLLKSKERGN